MEIDVIKIGLIRQRKKSLLIVKQLIECLRTHPFIHWTFGNQYDLTASLTVDRLFKCAYYKAIAGMQHNEVN